MGINFAQAWANIVANTESRLRTLERLANVEADWGMAKEQRQSTEESLLEADKEMVAKYADELPTKEWKRLQALHADRFRANEKFELIDRDRRKLVKLRDDQTEGVLKLLEEYTGDKQQDMKFEPADDSGPTWRGVELSYLLGPMMAGHFTPHGLATVGQAHDAMAGTALKALVQDETLTKDLADYLRHEIITYLDMRDVKHELGKASKKVVIPDAPAKGGKAEAEPATDDGPKLVELSNPVWDDACRCKGKIDADNAIVGTTRRPWKPFELAAGATFMIFEDQPEVNRLNAVQVIPLADWQKNNADRKPRQQMGLPDEPNPLADLLVASDQGELVCGRTVTFALATHKKPKDIKPAAPTPGKPKHKPAHPKGKGGRAAVRRKAEAVAQ